MSEGHEAPAFAQLRELSDGRATVSCPEMPRLRHGACAHLAPMLFPLSLKGRSGQVEGQVVYEDIAMIKEFMGRYQIHESTTLLNPTYNVRVTD
jgi:hypothetical protein